MSQRSEYVKHHRTENDYVEIMGVKVADRDSPNARHVFFPQLEDDENEGWHWVPFSQTRDREGVIRTGEHNGDTICVTRWWAKKVGLDV